MPGWPAPLAWASPAPLMIAIAAVPLLTPYRVV